MSIYTKEEIALALNEKVDTFINYVMVMNKDAFESAPEGKWNAGQNLDHLIRSIKPLQLAYSLPKFFLKLRFGLSNRPTRSFNELVTKYKTRLAAGGRASGPFIPTPVLFEKKETLINEYVKQKNKLIKKIKRQNEKDLDKFILPHPLLGKLTLREMLFFTIHHNEHHLELLKSRN